MNNLSRLSERVNALRRATGGSLTCGWMYDEVSLMLYSLVKLSRPVCVIQTGHLWGKSACAVLEAMTDDLRIEDEEQNADKAFANFVRHRIGEVPHDSVVISIDPSPLAVPHWEAGIALLQKWYGPRFDFRKAYSSDFFRENIASLRAKWAGRRLIGIVDGDHSEAGCWKDMVCLSNLGAELILVDDVLWLPHIDKAAKRFSNEFPYCYLNLPYFNGFGMLVHSGSVHC